MFSDENKIKAFETVKPQSSALCTAAFPSPVRAYFCSLPSPGLPEEQVGNHWRRIQAEEKPLMGANLPGRPF